MNGPYEYPVSEGYIMPNVAPRDHSRPCRACGVLLTLVQSGNPIVHKCMNPDCTPEARAEALAPRCNDDE